MDWRRILIPWIFVLCAVLAYGQSYNQQVSPKGVDMIKSFESLQTKAYWDKLAKVWSIGYGETKGVKAGMVWTKQQCRDSLRRRINDFTKPINRWQARMMKPNQFDATSCLSWNSGAIKKPLRKAINNNDAGSIRYNFMKIVYSRGKYSKGLHDRRIKELNTYFNNEYYINSREL